MLTLKRKRPMHKWSDKNRIILCLLKRENYPRKVIAQIWSHIFRRQLALEGFQTDILATTLDSQFQEMKKGGHGYGFYQVIHNATDKVIENDYGAYKKEIEEATQSLQLDVTTQLSSNQRPKRARISTRKQKASRTISPATTVASQEPTELQPSHSSSSRIQSFAFEASPYFGTTTEGSSLTASAFLPSSPVQETMVPPVISISTDKDGNITPKHPLLLFRATPSITHFLSRRFQLQKNFIGDPPAFGTKEFRHIAWPHLERDKSYPSPFISFAQNPQDTLRRVELARSEDVDTKMFLVIFAFNDLHEDAIRQFGHNNGPYLVRSLFTKKEISDLPCGYKGAGEWLVYGAIRCEPIVTLDSAQAIGLAKALRLFKAGETSAVIRISEVLQSVPVRWREAVAYNLLLRCCKTKIEKLRGPTYTSLMRAILDNDADFLRLYATRSKRTGQQGEEAEDGDWQDVSMRQQDLEDEEPAAFTSSSNNNTTPLSRQPLQRVNPNVVPRVIIPPRVPSIKISKLNNMASKTTAVTRTHRTPLWSPDSEDEAIGGEDRCHSLAAAIPDNSSEADWELLNGNFSSSDDLEYDWPVSLQNSTVPSTGMDAIVPSIERAPAVETNDTFMMELISSATVPTPSPAPTNLHSQTPFHDACQATTIDLTTDELADRIHKTPVKKSRQNDSWNGFGDEDDIVITASGRRRAIRLALRSLSVQDE